MHPCTLPCIPDTRSRNGWMRCNACGEVFPLNVYDEKTWACPRCGAFKNYVLASGLEFTIDRIEAA